MYLLDVMQESLITWKSFFGEMITLLTLCTALIFYSGSMQSAVTFGWWFPRKSQHSNKEISLVFLANNAQSSKLRRKLSSWKKTFENVGISALLSHEESHWYSRYWINCCPLSKERGSNWRITGSSVVLPRSKQFTARTKWVRESKWQVARWPLSSRNKRFMAGTTLIKIERRPERKSANFTRPQSISIVLWRK